MGLAFKLRSEFTPKGDQPAAIESLIKSFEAGAQYQTLLGITGSGKTFTVANVIAAAAEADADHGAEQDAGGAAVRRDARAVSRQRRRVLRQLLRLLPARGVHPDERHLHREGRDHQRADRSHAARGDALAAVAPRRDHRRPVSLHLRHRLGREVPRAAHRPRARARRCAATSCCASWSTSSTSATTSTFIAARSACAATWSRSSRRTRRARDAHRVLRRRGRGDQRDRSAARQGAGTARPLRDLSRARTTSRRAAAAASARSRRSATSCASGCGAVRQRGQLLEKQRLEQRTMYDLEMLEQMGFCTASRTTRATSRGASRASRRRR